MSMVKVAVFLAAPRVLALPVFGGSNCLRRGTGARHAYAGRYAPGTKITDIPCDLTGLVRPACVNPPQGSPKCTSSLQGCLRAPRKMAPAPDLCESRS